MEIKEFDIISSKREKYNFISFEKLLEDIQKYKYVIVYKKDGVTVDIPSKIKSLENLLELRSFDENSELKVILAGNGFIGRIINDGVGDSTEILEETHLLWGKPSNKEIVDEGYTFLLEDRGTKLTLPIWVEEGKRAFIRVRNYLKCDKFIFNDYRMVDFLVKEAKEYGR